MHDWLEALEQRLCLSGNMMATVSNGDLLISGGANSTAITTLSYSLGAWPLSIWYHRKWSTALKYTFDGLLYAGMTAGTFGWLWPK